MDSSESWKLLEKPIDQFKSINQLNQQCKSMKTITFRLATFLKYSLIFTMLFSIGNLYAQNHRVSGTITHEGNPLLGATIMIKDTQRGTTTDMDGYFELQAQDDDVLVVSYLGYKTQEVPIQGITTLHIELTTDADMLDTVEIT